MELLISSSETIESRRFETSQREEEIMERVARWSVGSSLLIVLVCSSQAWAQSCGTGGTKDGIKIPSAQESPTVARVCKNGVVKGGMAPFAPHGFQDAAGVYRGPTVELIGPTVASLLGVRFEVVPIGWDSVVPGLVAARYDMITSGLTFTPERTKVIDYVLNTVAGTCYIVRKDSDIKSLDQMDAPTVRMGVFTGTSWETDLPKRFPKAKFDASVQGQGGGYRVEDLLARRIDVAPIDNVAAYAFEASFPGLRVIPPPAECLKNPDPQDRLGIGVTKGDEAFKALVQAVVTRHKDQIDAMITKYSSPEYIKVGK
jgi:ABC-type amino acid transport substrate-binding protein